QSKEFKCSKEFIKILDRFVKYFEHHMIEFGDVYFGGKLIFPRHLLKSSLLNNKINMPAAQRLERIKSIIIDKISPIQKDLLDKIEKIVEKTGGHEFEIKSFSRLLAKKVTKRFIQRIQRFTYIDYFRAYKALFNSKDLILRLAKGVTLPSNIEEIISYTSLNINSGHISYGDIAPLIYLRLKLKGSSRFKDIKQVVVDEAQDYSPMHYAVMNIIFKDASFTILGDINQSIEKDLDISLYDTVNEIFQKRKSIKLTMVKSFRSTKEICDFNNRLLNKKVDAESFERHGETPSVVYKDTLLEIDNQIVQDIRSFFSEGYESIAVICKTLNESKDLFTRLSAYKDINLTDFEINEINKGVSVIPSYMAKGLEFDVALIYNVADDNYNTKFDRRLLYIACTRALHRLTLYYTGVKSRFI
ncbi:MAG TPA: 3'-5' exonuclease, partial [Clostridia bacterium]